jgi:pseudaminic acid cytidylyltransferase
MSSLAIIPARGGSKRIPRKNIRSFLGRPIISYSIETALRSGLFSEVMVSTEDEEIATVARQWGAHIPFLRNPATADDHAIIADVLGEVIERYAASGRHFATACCLLPTAPLIEVNDLLVAREKLTGSSFDCVFPVCRFSYPIWRSLKQEGNRVLMNWPEYYASRSQDLPPAYHDCGQFYWFLVDRFLKSRRLFTENAGAIELPAGRVQDIDSEEDWALCELKFQRLRQRYER